MNEIERRIYTAEIVNDLYKEVEQKAKSLRYNYAVIGEEQVKKWNSEACEWEPQWNEDGTPMMRDKWGDVERDELTDDDKERLEILEDLQRKLAKMI